MNPFDLAILSWLNRAAGHSQLLDRTIGLVEHANLLKGGVLLAAIWWAWFLDDAGGVKDTNRRRVIATLLGVMAALAFGKACQLAFGFRPRPIHLPALGLTVPFGLDTSVLDGWSAFPSDHAILFAGLSTGLIHVSRRVGYALLAYSVAVVMLPRTYLLLHYPTDLIAGAAIGVAGVALAQRLLVDSAFADATLRWVARSPQFAYPLFFLVSFQTAVLFDDVRQIAAAVPKAFRQSNA